MKKILEYEIVDHGVEHEQYFQGCGVSFTKFDGVATGIGNSLKEALEDAAEGLAQQGYEINADLEKEIGAASDENALGVSEESDEYLSQDANYYYASIRVKESK